MTTSQQPAVRYRSARYESSPAQDLQLPQTAVLHGPRSILHLNSTVTARTPFKAPKPADGHSSK
jgi:hypothetical protein